MHRIQFIRHPVLLVLKARFRSLPTWENYPLLCTDAEKSRQTANGTSPVQFVSSVHSYICWFNKLSSQLSSLMLHYDSIPLVVWDISLSLTFSKELVKRCKMCCVCWLFSSENCIKTCSFNQSFNASCLYFIAVVWRLLETLFTRNFVVFNNSRSGGGGGGNDDFTILYYDILVSELFIIGVLLTEKLWYLSAHVSLESSRCHLVCLCLCLYNHSWSLSK